MVVTAWNGGGDHHFTRVQFEPTLERHSRDALHFSDQRIGPTFIDCTIGYTGADLRLSPPPICAKTRKFAKAGSGQTSDKVKRKTRFCR
jgi:hypothetical protein